MENLISELRPYNITGFLSPFHPNNQPCLVQMPDNPNYWALAYSNVEALENSCKYLGFTDYKIKHIDDGFEFVKSLSDFGVRVMANPYMINGKTRWTECLEE